MRDYLTAVGAAVVIVAVAGFIAGAIDGWRIYRIERRDYDRLMARRRARFYDNQATLAHNGPDTVLELEDIVAERLDRQREFARFN